MEGKHAIRDVEEAVCTLFQLMCLCMLVYVSFPQWWKVTKYINCSMLIQIDVFLFNLIRYM